MKLKRCFHDPDLIPCRWCGRRFHEQAAKNHIPHCEQRCKDQDVPGRAKETSSDHIPSKSYYAKQVGCYGNKAQFPCLFSLLGMHHKENTVHFNCQGAID